MNKLKGILSESGLLSKLLIIIGFSCFFTILGMAIWTVLASGNVDSVGSLKLLQLVQSIGVFVLPPFVLAYLCYHDPLNFLHLDKKIKWTNIAFVVVFMIVIIPFINLLGDLNQKLVLPKAFAALEDMMKASEKQAGQLTEKLLNVHSVPALFYNIFLIAMIPALGEELFFRGALQGVFRQKINVKVAIWVAALIFSAIHFQFYGFVPRMLLGAFFGYLLIWSENIWLPVAAHFTNNGIAVIFYYLKNNGFEVVDIDAVGVGGTLWVGCISGVMAMLGFYLFLQYFQKQKNVVEEP
jgi:membrane protease YdiL (CAAX protease family)